MPTQHEEYTCITIIVDTEDSSYRRVWETIKVVSKEFKHQGHCMKGPCASLVTGNSDKNIARDIQRSYNRLQLDPVTCCIINCFFSCAPLINLCREYVFKCALAVNAYYQNWGSCAHGGYSCPQTTWCAWHRVKDLMFSPKVHLRQY